MAVYTRISEEDLKNHLTHFDLGTLVSFEGIAEGVENTNYFVETSQGKYVLTLFEKRVSLEDLPFYITFMEYLREKSVPAPIALAAREGGKIVPLQGKPSVIATFIPGGWLKEPGPSETAQVGEILARMHQIGRLFPLKRRNTLSLPNWKNLIHAAGKDAEKVEKGLFSRLAAELSFLQKNWPKYLPKGAVHADLFPDNVFFDGRKLSGVLDFYFACTETFAYDLMLTLNAWCFDKNGRFDVEKSRALLSAYQKVRPLTKNELKALPFFGRAAAVRIISTRLYDWLNPAAGALVKPKDPLEHVRIMKFHQSLTSPASYGINP